MNDLISPELVAKVLADPAAMRDLLLAFTEREIRNGPRAAALDRIAKTDGDFSITDAAKVLGLHPRQLAEHLVALKWCYRRRRTNAMVAYQTRIDAKLMRHRAVTVRGSDGEPRTVSQPLVTAKGLATLASILVPETAIETGGGQKAAEATSRAKL